MLHEKWFLLPELWPKLAETVGHEGFFNLITIGRKISVQLKIFLRAGDVVGVGAGGTADEGEGAGEVGAGVK